MIDVIPADLISAGKVKENRTAHKGLDLLLDGGIT